MLHNFNLPSCEVWFEGKQCYKDEIYIYKNKILKALRTGNDLIPDKRGDFYLESANYTWGMKLPNLTTNMRLDSLTYDSYTHNYLGRYLRFYRDYTGIDLMPMYNCFSNDSVSNISIIDNTGKVLMQSDNTCTIYDIDVKLHKVYTVYVSCPTEVELIACYYSNGRVIDLSSGYNISFPYESTRVIKTNTQFNDPFIYDNLTNVANWEGMNEEQLSLLYKERKNLKLFIKVPKENKSSIVVLEGDYMNSLNHYLSGNGQKFHKTIIAAPYVPGQGEEWEPIKQYLVDQNIPREYDFRLELTHINSNVNHPFSNRLIEYLFGNVIKPDDEIDNNISRLQNNLVRRPLDKIALNKIISSPPLLFHPKYIFYTYFQILFHLYIHLNFRPFPISYYLIHL